MYSMVRTLQIVQSEVLSSELSIYERLYSYEKTTITLWTTVTQKLCNTTCSIFQISDDSNGFEVRY